MNQLDVHLGLKRIDGEERIVCRHCGENICSRDRNYKRHLLSAVRSVEEAGPKINSPEEFVDDEIEFRQYYCPGCGTLVENEFLPSGHDPIQDKSIQ